MKHFFKATFLLGFIFIGLVLSACGQLTPNSEVTTEVNSEEEIVETPAAAEIHLDNGNHIEFFTEEGLPDAVVLESADSDRVSAFNVLSDELGIPVQDISSFEVFWAFSELGTAVPEFLEVASTEREQGWARELVSEATGDVHTAHANVACDNGNFLLGLINNLVTTKPIIELDKKPSSYNAFKSYPWKGSIWYKYKKTLSHANKWYARVCIRAVQNVGNNHVVNGIYYGPVLKYQYRLHGTTKWKNSFVRTIPANSLRLYYIKRTYKPPKTVNRRVYITRAKGLDQFDIANDVVQIFPVP